MEAMFRFMEHMVKKSQFSFFVAISFIYRFVGAKGDWDFRISDLVKKTLMELIFNPCGEFR